MPENSNLNFTPNLFRFLYQITFINILFFYIITTLFFRAHTIILFHKSSICYFLEQYFIQFLDSHYCYSSFISFYKHGGHRFLFHNSLAILLHFPPLQSHSPLLLSSGDRLCFLHSSFNDAHHNTNYKGSSYWFSCFGVVHSFGSCVNPLVSLSILFASLSVFSANQPPLPVLLFLPSSLVNAPQILCDSILYLMHALNRCYYSPK